jgi:DNA-binding cell septation regulator SpoVG
MMKIDKKSIKTGDWGKTKAFFTITTNEGFEIKGCKLVDGQNGFFIAPPSQKDKEGNYKPQAWIPKELQQDIIDIVSNEVTVEGSYDDGIPF